VITAINVPGISCDTCKNAIEGALRPVGGVAAVTVDVAAKTVTVEHDPAAGPASRLATLIEDQAYDVAGWSEVV